MSNYDTNKYKQSNCIKARQDGWIPVVLVIGTRISMRKNSARTTAMNNRRILLIALPCLKENFSDFSLLWTQSTIENTSFAKHCQTRSEGQDLTRLAISSRIDTLNHAIRKLAKTMCSCTSPNCRAVHTFTAVRRNVGIEKFRIARGWRHWSDYYRFNSENRVANDDFSVMHFLITRSSYSVLHATVRKFSKILGNYVNVIKIIE